MVHLFPSSQLSGHVDAGSHVSPGSTTPLPQAAAGAPPVAAPPTPSVAPPLPESDRVTRLAWAGLIGGPVLIMIAAVFGLSLGGWVLVAALAAFLGGFATLILRMGDRRSDDDGWDDGAVL